MHTLHVLQLLHVNYAVVEQSLRNTCGGRSPIDGSVLCNILSRFITHRYLRISMVFSSPYAFIKYKDVI